MNHRRTLIAILGLMLEMLRSLDAQTTWTVQNSGTTQDLWGIGYRVPIVIGGLNPSGSYVVVGTGGTILTSPDASVWTAQTSGTSTWLLGVASTTFLTVVVGDEGTILTSPDGTTFTPVATETTQNIEAISLHAATSSQPAYFTAAGGGGTVGTLTFPQFGSPVWTSTIAGTSSSYYRGVDQGGVVGQGGAAALEIGGGAYFAPVQLPQTNDLNAIFGNGMLIAVGQGGIISTFTGTSPGPGTIAASQSPGFIGYPEALQAPTVTGATYQWYLNGIPIAGATAPILTVASVQSSNAGTYLESRPTLMAAASSRSTGLWMGPADAG